MPKLWIAALAVLCINLPFGYWRAGTRKFSWPWFLAVHLPIPLVIGVRLYAGLGFQLVTYPLLVGAFVSGQYLGGRLRAGPQGDPEADAEAAAVPLAPAAPSPEEEAP